MLSNFRQLYKYEEQNLQDLELANLVAFELGQLLGDAIRDQMMYAVNSVMLEHMWDRLEEWWNQQDSEVERKPEDGKEYHNLLQQRHQIKRLIQDKNFETAKWYCESFVLDIEGWISEYMPEPLREWGYLGYIVDDITGQEDRRTDLKYDHTAYIRDWIDLLS